MPAGQLAQNQSGRPSVARTASAKRPGGQSGAGAAGSVDRGCAPVTLALLLALLLNLPLLSMEARYANADLSVPMLLPTPPPLLPPLALSVPGPDLLFAIAFTPPLASH